jgi:AsmA protein
MRKLGYAVGIVVLLVIAILFIGPFLIPQDGLKARVAAAASQATGRPVQIDGAVRFTVLPHLRVEAHDVSLANAPGAGPQPLAKFATLALDLEVFPLLSGTVAVDRLELTDPVIALEVDAQGKPNWVFAAAAPSGATPAAPTANPTVAPPPSAPPPQGDAGLNQLELNNIHLINGRVSYLDHRTNESKTIDQVNISLSLPSLDQKLAAEGSVVLNGKKIDLVIGVDKPRALLAGSSSALSARLSGEPVIIGFKGSGAVQPALALNGDVDLEVPSLRGLAAWAGQPLGQGGSNTFGPLSLTGKLALAGSQAKFSQAKLSLDAIKATGDLALDSSGAHPAIKGQLEVDRLDLNPYGATASAAPTRAAPATPAGASAPTSAAPATAREWSAAPLDFAGLKAADLDLNLSLGSLTEGKLLVGKSAMKVALKDGKLDAELTQMTLYEGTGTGRVGLDSTGAFELTAKLDHVAVQPFLRDALGIDRVTGTGAFDIALASHGQSERALISALDGKGSLNLADGAVQGVDLGAMVKNVGAAFESIAAGNPQKTEFASLAGTYAVNDGMLKSNDLELKSPVMTVAGNGTVDLPHRQVDYRLTPKLVANAQGAGSVAANLMVPVLITGPLDQPQFKPDLAAAVQQQLKNPSALLNAVKSGHGTHKPGDVLNNLPGLGH